ncbi:MAG: hypothetical protein ACE5O2_04575 [Armatimonadota bacterium]
MRIVNADASVYLLCSQVVPCKPGEFYEFSVWVKTRGVKGEETGATVCMEWSGDEGWIGGAYPAGVKGDSDWTLIRGQTPRIPPDAKRVTVTVYLRKGMTGTAWFDDVQVRRGFPPPLAVNLLAPNYRGLIFPEVKSAKVRIEARIGQPLRGDLGLNDVELRVQLLRGEARSPDEAAAMTTVTSRRIRPGSPTVRTALDASKLRPGKYTLRVRLLGGRQRRVLGERYFPVEMLRPDAKPPRVYIDQHNRTIVNGEPFFPLGMYFGGGPASRDAERDLRTFAASSFNTLMNYGINGGSLEEIEQYLDMVNSLGLKIIYSIKDFYDGTRWRPKQVGPWTEEADMVEGIVNRFKRHPAVLAWYLNDELPVSFLPRLTERYETVRALDPDHPTWIVLYQVGQLERYLPTFDVLGTDPYPIPEGPVTRAAEWTIRTVEAVNGRRAVWMVPQAHNWSVYRKGEKPVRGPTYEEMKAMAFLCIVHGAKGLIFYSFQDLKRDPLGFDKRWADVRRVADDVAQVVPIILSTERRPKLRITRGADGVHAAAFERNGVPYVIAINATTEEKAFSFRLGTMSKVALTLDGSQVVGRRKDEFRDTLGPLAVRIYELRTGGEPDVFPLPRPTSPRGRPGNPPWT